MQLAEYVRYDALGLAGLIREGNVSAQEVLTAAIAQIGNLNPLYNAVVETLFDQARRDIDILDPSAPFYGVPYLIKDLHTHVKGSHLTQGCRFLKGNVSPRDSDLVRRLRKAGFVIVGRSNTPEFGLNTTTEPEMFGPSRNPWNRAYSTGGSSGGSAAAVMSGMVPAAHATDSGGSIRIPASCCGLVGLKPTRGRILAGLDYGEGWHDMFTAHTVTRSVRDSAAILLATWNKTGPAPYRCSDPLPETVEGLTRPVRERLKIGVLATPPSGVAVDPECQQALGRAELLCRDLGHDCQPIELTYDTRACGQAFTLILSAKVAAAIDFHEMESGRKATPGHFESAVWHCVERGRQASASDLNRATALIHLIGQDIADQVAALDLVMSPTVARPPMPIGELVPDGDDISAFLARVFEFAPFTSMFNVTGQPAISLPLYWSKAGLPIGIQFAAPHGREDILLRLATDLERVVDWPKRYQDVWADTVGEV